MLISKICYSGTEWAPMTPSAVLSFPCHEFHQPGRIQEERVWLVVLSCLLLHEINSFIGFKSVYVLNVLIYIFIYLIVFCCIGCILCGTIFLSCLLIYDWCLHVTLHGFVTSQTWMRMTSTIWKVWFCFTFYLFVIFVH